MIAGKPFRTLDERSWDIERRLRDMDSSGIAVQVLSPMPELLSYWFENEGAEAFCDFINADLAEQVARMPSRFAGLGTIPMQDPGLAVRHLVRIKETFGLSGVEIGSNINGLLLGDACFDPVFAAARDLDLAIFVHALHPIVARNVEAPAGFGPLVGFPVDTGVAAASLIMSGTLERYPGLRIGFSHGGGGLAPIVDRLEFAWSAGKIPGNAVQRSPAATAAGMFFDSNVYSKRYLKFICEHFAPRRIFLGTDYPYAIMQENVVAFAAAADLDSAASESLLWGAAHAFLND